MLLYSPDEKVTNEMLQMRYDPDKGLSRSVENCFAVEVVLNKNRKVWGIQIYPRGCCSCCQPLLPGNLMIRYGGANAVLSAESYRQLRI